MAEIINLYNSEYNIEERNQFELVSVSEEMLAEVRSSLSSERTLSMPIAQISTLGAGVSSLIPAFRTVTQTVSKPSKGLYKVANSAKGDALKMAKNGNYWGSLKTPEGNSKLVQLSPAKSANTTTQTVAAVNPAIMMMAVALFLIEQKIDKIEDMEKQILSFLEIEKEAEIEADVETLMSIINSYKHNWDNERYTADNHKLVLDIQRTARKNMLSYQKKVNEILDTKKFIVAQTMVETSLKDLQKKFQYYRLSLYNFSLASLSEIMLSGNYKEENVSKIRDEIEKRSLEYREAFTRCSEYLAKMTGASIETNVLKGVGIASKAVGKFIGSIPVVKEGQVDEFLQESGEKIKNKSKGIEIGIIDTFAEISNPETRVFIEKMDEMIQIYNHTESIYFDENRIYLMA